METEYFEKDGIKYQSYKDSNGKLKIRKFVSNKQFDDSKEQRQIYLIWRYMRKRCQAKNQRYSRYYFKKGIKVCEEWNNLETGFENFYKWSLENNYQIGLSIDRIDSSKGYCPENCRWITLDENRRLGVAQKRKPKWEYTAYNKSLNTCLKFYRTREFQKYTGIDFRRVSDGCKNPEYEYKGWKFSRRAINLNYYESQETIPTGSTLEDELPAEVRIIFLPIEEDKDIVHTA